MGTLSELAGLADLDGPDAIERVERLLAELPSCSDPERLDALARALPRQVATLAPELALSLRRLALALADHQPRIPTDLDRLEPVLRVAWLQVRLISVTDRAELEAIPDRELRRAIQTNHDWTPLRVVALPILLQRMIEARDDRLRGLVPELVSTAMQELALTGEQAFACLHVLAKDPEPRVRRAAFAGLRAFGFASLSPDSQLLRDAMVRAGLELEDPAIVETCIGLALQLEQRTWLLELACDERARPGGRASALAQLGELATEEDLELGLELAREDPILFGSAARQLVLDAHRHGAFVREPMIPALLDAFDQHFEWTGEALVRVSHIARARLLDALDELAADDVRWIRRAEILAASVGTRAHEQIASLLRATTDPRVAAALVSAASRSPDFSDEAALLQWLDRIPELVIPGLRVKGGAASVERLRALVLDPACPARLRPLALEVLWALADDRRALQHELSRALGPRASGLFETTHAFVHDDLAATLVSDPIWPDRPEHRLAPLEVLQICCASGDPRLLPTITRLFRTMVRTIVGKALVGDFTIKRLRLPELEQQVYRYGRTLVAQGRSVRRFLADDQPETGRDLVLSILIDWLREEPEPAICVALLESIARHEPQGATLQLIHGYWRHRDPEVARAAIEALIESGESMRGLELSIGRLSTASDPRILRQALAAVTHLRASWAEPMVIAALQRPEMAIKKAAAAALAEIGSSRCVPALIEWIGYHDNEAFRVSLLEALDHAAGRSATAVLVEALGQAKDARGRGLLHDALGGRLSLTAALRLARSSQPSHVALVEAMLAGNVRLSGSASVQALAAALHRAKLRPIPVSEDPTRRIRIEGFSSEAALELLEARTPANEPSLVTLIRASLPVWVTWLFESDGELVSARLGALELVLMAATRSHAEQLDRLLELAERAGGETIAVGALVKFVSECLVPESDPRRRARALRLLRASPPSPSLAGPTRFRLLGQLGAVRTPADLDVCLAACRVGPNLVQDSTRLLMAALSIPDASADEVRVYGEARARTREQLREGARSWHRLAPSEASEWLATMLADRPLDVPLISSPPPDPKPAFFMYARDDLARQHEALGSDDEQVRERAAALILARPDAQAIEPGWRPVLDAYLGGRIPIGPHRRALARLLTEWPRAAKPRARALALLPELDRHQVRQLLPAFLAAWDRNEPDAAEPLRAIDQDLLVSVARARAEAGDLGLLQLLRRSDSLALQSLVDWVSRRDPQAVAHLVLVDASEPVQSDADLLPTDPIADKSLDQLVALIEDRSVELGLAVRAIHALAQFEPGGAEALDSLTVDRRPRVRSAALRALRSATTRDRYLDAVTEVLGIETRSDVIVQLLASLGHAHHGPGLSVMLEFLAQGDVKLQAGARAALLAWGSDIAPALRRAASKARPDRRPAIEAILDQLEHDSDAEVDDG